jgi:hypothetical protein
MAIPLVLLLAMILLAVLAAVSQALADHDRRLNVGAALLLFFSVPFHVVSGSLGSLMLLAGSICLLVAAVRYVRREATRLRTAFRELREVVRTAGNV